MEVSNLLGVFLSTIFTERHVAQRLWPEAEKDGQICLNQISICEWGSDILLFGTSGTQWSRQDCLCHISGLCIGPLFHGLL